MKKGRASNARPPAFQNSLIFAAISILYAVQRSEYFELQDTAAAVTRQRFLQKAIP